MLLKSVSLGLVLAARMPVIVARQRLTQPNSSQSLPPPLMHAQHPKGGGVRPVTRALVKELGARGGAAEGL